MNRDGCKRWVRSTSQGKPCLAHGKRGHAFLWLSKNIPDKRKWPSKAGFDRAPGRPPQEHSSARFGILPHRNAHSPDQRLMRGILHQARSRSTWRLARPFLRVSISETKERRFDIAHFHKR